MISSLYIYHQHFSNPWEGSFFNLLKTTIQSVSAEDILILVPTQTLKSQFLDFLISDVGECVVPDLFTLDELLLQSNFSSFQDDCFLMQLVLKYILSTSNNEFPEIFYNKQMIDSLLLFFTEALRYGFYPESLMKEKDVAHKEHLVYLFKEFQSAAFKFRPLPLLSLYQQSAMNKHKDILAFCQNKTLFAFGFWDVPKYQWSLMKVLLTLPGKHALGLLYQAGQKKYDAACSFYFSLKNELENVRDLVENPSDSTTSIVASCCLSIKDEVRYVSETIYQLLSQESSVSIDEIAIVLSNPSIYLSEMEFCLSEIGIPFKSLGRSFSEAPIAQFLSVVFDLAQHGPTHAKLFAFFSHPFSRYFDFLLNEQRLNSLGASLVFPETWAEWDSGLNSLYQKKCIEKNNDAFIFVDQKFLNAWSELRSLIQGLYFARSMSQFEHHVTTLLKRFSFNLAYKTLNDEQSVQFKADLEVLDEALSHFNRFESVFMSDFDPGQALEYFSLCLEAMSRKQVGEGLLITGKFESFMLKKKYIYLLGASQELFYASSERHSFLPLALQERFKWPTGQQRQLADNYLLFALTQTPGSSVFLSFPKTYNDMVQEVLPLFSDLPIAEPVIPRVGPQKSLCQRSHFEGLSQSIQPVFSVSQLESYFKCPYQYYLQRFVSMEQHSYLSLDVPAQDWGSCFHAAFKEFVEGWPYESDDIAGQVFAKNLESSCFKILPQQPFLIARLADYKPGSKVFTKLLNNIRNLLNDYEVFHVEFPFECQDLLGLDGVMFKGRIDLILKHRERDVLCCVDLKTGSVLSGPTGLMRFDSIQLPLYIMILERLFPAFQVAGGIYIQCCGEKQEVKVPLYDPELEEFLPFKKQRGALKWEDGYKASLRGHLKEMCSLILDKKFSYFIQENDFEALRRRKTACSFCQFKSLCFFPQRWESTF